MFFCTALFIMFLGYFQGESKIMIGGAVAAVVTFFIGAPDILTMVGFDGEAIYDAMTSNAD